VGPTLRTLLLCGGRSSRFGSDKLMAELAIGRMILPMAAWAARRAVQGSGNALAVIPPRSAALRAALEESGCEILESESTARGLGASLAAGVRHSGNAPGWLVALGDMPFIDAATFRAVAEALLGGALIAAPVFRLTNARGHPVGFSNSLRGELLALDGDEGARSVIARHEDRVTSIPVDDRGIVVDIDTPDDFDAAAQAQL
jgi:molybdenum cofactor cytidylyltransferase